VSRVGACTLAIDGKGASANDRRVERNEVRISFILRTVATSWIAVFANAVVGFFLTPYILHHIGDEAFGLWVLVVTLSGYYGFFDAGIRSSVLRYVSRYSALGDRDDVNRVVATAFYFYLIACVLTIFLTILLVPILPGFFSFHSDTVRAFQSLFLLAGVVQGVTFPLIVFAGVLEAAARYDQVYLVQIGSLAFRVVLVIAVFRAGGGLFGVGAAVILSNLLAYVIQTPLAIRALGGLSLSPLWLSKSIFRDMLRYGAISFGVGTGEKLRGYIYPLVVAKFLSPTAVTIFSLPMKLLAFPTSGLATMTEIVNPISSHLETKKNFAKLRLLVQLSVQSAFLILAPMVVFLLVFGRELLTLWVGARYASAYSLLVLLTLGMGAAATQCCVQSMLFGIERHKGLMWYRLGEGLAISILGSVAVKVWGLEGFALVIAVTLLLTSLVLVPRHLCRILDLPLRRYLIEGALKPCLVALPLTGVLLGVHSLLVVHRWADMIIAVLIGGLAYAFTLSIYLFGRSSVPRWLSLSVLDLLEEKYLRTNGFLKSFLLSRTVRPGESQTEL